MSKGSRTSFIFYRSFYEAIQDLSDSDKLIIYEAITQYALDKTEPNLSGFPLTIFKLIRPQIDANWKRYENGAKGAEHGAKGGAPNGNQNAKRGKTTPNQPQNNGKTTPNVNVNDNVNENISPIIPQPGDGDSGFENAWQMYGRKGNKKTSVRRWASLKGHRREAALKHIPRYVASTPDIQYRKNFEAYLNQEVWNDEITPASGSIPQQPQSYTLAVNPS